MRFRGRSGKLLLMGSYVFFFIFFIFSEIYLLLLLLFKKTVVTLLLEARCPIDLGLRSTEAEDEEEATEVG